MGRACKDPVLVNWYKTTDLIKLANENNVSRAAVQKTIKNVLDKLKYYEDMLHVYDKNVRLRNLIDESNIGIIKNEIEKILAE